MYNAMYVLGAGACYILQRASRVWACGRGGRLRRALGAALSSPHRALAVDPARVSIQAPDCAARLCATASSQFTHPLILPSCALYRCQMCRAVDFESLHSPRIPDALLGPARVYLLLAHKRRCRPPLPSDAIRCHSAAPAPAKPSRTKRNGRKKKKLTPVRLRCHRAIALSRLSQK